MKLPYNFSSFPAVLKLATHLNLMAQSRYDVLPDISPDFQSVSRFVNREAMSEAFLNDADERNVPLQAAIKPIHGEGISAPIEFVPVSNFYTGIFKTGGVGILRLSRATASDPFTPGLALKLLVDGDSSVNFHAMYSLDGQEIGRLRRKSARTIIKALFDRQMGDKFAVQNWLRASDQFMCCGEDNYIRMALVPRGSESWNSLVIKE